MQPSWAEAWACDGVSHSALSELPEATDDSSSQAVVARPSASQFGMTCGSKVCISWWVSTKECTSLESVFQEHSITQASYLLGAVK